MSAALRCKPGELAFVVRSEFPTNVGLVIEVCRIALRIEDWRGVPPGGFVWLVKTCGRDIVIRTAVEDGVSVDYLNAHGVCLDTDLRPIRGEEPRNLADTSEAIGNGPSLVPAKRTRSRKATEPHGGAR